MSASFQLSGQSFVLFTYLSESTLMVPSENASKD